MKLLSFLRPKSTAPVARERLQILLAHERLAVGQADLVSILRQEILATIARHVEFDPEKVKVQLGGAGSMSTLEIDIELPAAPMPPADRKDVPPPPRQRRLRRRAPTGPGSIFATLALKLPVLVDISGPLGH